MTKRLGDRARDLVKPIIKSHEQQATAAEAERTRLAQEQEQVQRARIPGILKDLGKKVLANAKYGGTSLTMYSDHMEPHTIPGFSEALYEWAKKEKIRVVYTPVYGKWNDYEGYPVDYREVKLEWEPST